MSHFNFLSLEDYYRAPGSYPAIQVQRPNKCYAKLLLKDYAGSVSELTAITTYVQNHLVGDSKKYELAVEAFKGVSIVEMEHLEMLGDTIAALGGFPRFSTTDLYGKKYFWNSSIIPTTTSVEEMLKEAIESEYAAINQYYKHIEAIDDYYVCKILARIIEDEKYHIKLFKKLLRQLN